MARKTKPEVTPLKKENGEWVENLSLTAKAFNSRLALAARGNTITCKDKQAREVVIIDSTHARFSNMPVVTLDRFVALEDPKKLLDRVVKKGMHLLISWSDDDGIGRSAYVYPASEKLGQISLTSIDEAWEKLIASHGEAEVANDVPKMLPAAE